MENNIRAARSVQPQKEKGKGGIRRLSLRFLETVTAVYLFLVALEVLSGAFVGMGDGAVSDLIRTTDNPFIGLFLGLLATAILQSSSLTTSIVVSLLASGAFGAASDPETISRAVPFILGANIGTTITSSIVSLGHIANIKEFRRALEAATLHDIFNILTVVVVLPLELMFGVLSKAAVFLAESLFVGGNSNVGESLRFVKVLTQPASEGFAGFNQGLFGTGAEGVIVACIIGLFGLFLSLRWVTLIVKRPLRGSVEKRLERRLFSSPLRSFGWGLGLTAAVQSSSLTTSFTVPLVASGRVSLSQAFPFIMGANVGTTVTALIVALLSSSSANPVAALAIAFCHLLFNFYGVLIFLPFRRIRFIPVWLATKLGNATATNRMFGVGYLLVIFFLIPFTLIALNQAMGNGNKPAELQANEKSVITTPEAEAHPYIDPIRNSQPGGEH